MSETETITAAKIGPVPWVEIPLDPEGGVTLLRGLNGSGKSITIDAIAKMLGGSQAVPCTDGEVKGFIEGFGVRVSIGKTSRRAGHCEATSLGGRFDLSEFVDPPIKDPEAADRVRIKALLAIRGVGPDAKRFEGLIDLDEFDDVVSTKALEARDLVEQARLVKADLEAESRKLEDRSKREVGAANACKHSADGVDVSGEDDAEKLQAALEDALCKKAQLEAHQGEAERAAQAAAEAQAALEKAKAEYTGPIMTNAAVHVDDAVRFHQAAKDKVDSLRERLGQAESSLTHCKATLERRIDLAEAADQHEAAMAGWQATINAGRPEPVPSETFAAASEATTEARKAIEQGVLVREAKAARIQETEHTKLAGQHRIDARRLREAAKATDTILSDAVASDSLWIEDGRMMTRHEHRAFGKCFFHDLSKGEKWAIAIPEAVRRIRELGAEGFALIPIPQPAWEGLDPANKTGVHRLARKHGVNIIAAEAADGELRAEVYDGTGD